MSVNSETNKVSYVANGSASYSIPFYFTDKTDIKVYLDDTPLDYGTDYTVTGEKNPAGGTLSMIGTPPNGGEALIVTREVNVTQGNTFTENGPYLAKTIEGMFDKLTFICQQLLEVQSRAVRFPISSDKNPQISGNLLGGGVLIIDEDGNGLSAGPRLADFLGELNQKVTDAQAAQTAAESAQTASESAQTAAEQAVTDVTTLKSDIETLISDASTTFNDILALATIEKNAALAAAVAAALSAEEAADAAGGAVGGLQTQLDELSDDVAEIFNVALGGDANFANTVLEALDNRLRFDIDNQTLTGPEKINAKTNIDLQNVDNTSDAAKNAAAVDLTNKKIKTTVELHGREDTKASLVTYAALGGTTNGQYVYATDDKKWYGIKDGALVPLGGGGAGGINYITNYNLEDDAAGFAVYKDAAGAEPVDGSGGSPVVTIARSTTSPLRGAASLLYTKTAVNSQGEGFSYDFVIDPSDIGKVLYGSFEYKLSSGSYANDDLGIYIYDITAGRIIPPAPNLIKTSNSVEHFAFSFQATLNTSYRLVIHNRTANVVACTVKFDNFAIGPDAKIYGSTNLVESHNIRLNTFDANAPSANIAIAYFTTIEKNSLGGILKIETDNILGTRFTALRKCRVVGLWIGQFATGQDVGWSLNSNQLSTSLNSITVSHRKSITRFTAGEPTIAPVELTMEEGDVLRPHCAPASRSGTTTDFFLDIIATADTQAVLVPTQQVNSDTIPFVFKSTAIVDSDPIGTYNTFTYAANANAPTISTSAPTQTSADMNANGVLITTKAFNAASNSSSPARFDIKIGKGLKGRVVDLYKNAGKLIKGTHDHWNSTGVKFGLTESTYDEKTGILTLNAATDILANTTVSRFYYNDNTETTSGYFVFSASSLISIAAIPVPENITASYWVSANFSASTTVPINFDSKEYDSHNSVTVSSTAWRFTAPISGTYSVGGLMNTGGNSFTFSIYKNGIAYKWLTQIPPGGIGPANTSIRLLAGEYIDFRPNASATITGAALASGATHIAIARTGNYV